MLKFMFFYFIVLFGNSHVLIFFPDVSKQLEVQSSEVYSSISVCIYFIYLAYEYKNKVNNGDKKY